MMTFAPRWNLRSRVLITLSVVFWLLFAGMTIFLGRSVLAQVLKQPDRHSIAPMVLTGAMMVGALVWIYGLASLIRVHYSVEAAGDTILWKTFHPWGNKELRMPLAAITGFAASGDPRTGLSLELKVGGRTRQLGSLLSSGDIHRLMLIIEEAKTRQAITGS